MDEWKLLTPLEWLELLVNRVEDDTLILAGDNGTIHVPLSAIEYWRIRAQILREGQGNDGTATRPDS